MDNLFTYEIFRETYRLDPASFVKDCFNWRQGEGPTEYQLDILSHIIEGKRLCVRGPHGLGKSCLAAWIILWFALTRDGDTDWKIACTASVFRQCAKFLAPEVKKWAKRIDWQKIGRKPFNENTEHLALSLKLGTGEMFMMASSEPGALEGCHASSVLVIFDEAKSIPDNIFDALEGVFSGGQIPGNELFALAISTPGLPLFRFYDIQSRKRGYEDWWVRHVTLSEAIDANRISQEWADQRKRQWGELSAIYQNRVLGEFCAEDETATIPLAWVEAAVERWYEWQEQAEKGILQALGVDVAGATEDSDTTVFAPVYQGYKVDSLEKYPKGDIDKATMEIAGRVKGKLDANEQAQAIIDVIGIGAGVGDRLAELGYSKRIVRFIASHKSEAKDKNGEFGFANKRSELWWKGRELLDPANGFEVALPPDSDLIGELTTPKWSVQSGAKITVEKKKDVKKRLNRSTDCADAVLQGLLGQAIYPAMPEITVVNLYDAIRNLERQNNGMD